MKKFISVFVMFTLLMFSISCYSTKEYKGTRLRYPPGEQYKIFWVVTKSGERIRFYGNDGAKILGRTIIGETYVDGALKVVRIPITKIEKIKMKASDNTKNQLLLGGIVVLAAGIFLGVAIVIGLGNID